MKAKGYKQGTGLYGLAVIRYQGADDAVPTAEPSDDRQGVVYQDMARSYEDQDAVTTVNELRSLCKFRVPLEEGLNSFLQTSWYVPRYSAHSDDVVEKFIQSRPHYKTPYRPRSIDNIRAPA